MCKINVKQRRFSQFDIYRRVLYNVVMIYGGNTMSRKNFVIGFCLIASALLHCDDAFKVENSDASSQLQETQKTKIKHKNKTILEDFHEELNVPSENYNSRVYNDVNYTSSTSFDLKGYFQNLHKFSPYNSEGSCGYVSLIQVMSYYDTFYNDGIIPEVYDRHSSSALTETVAKLSSPGVLRQSYSASSGLSYYEYCHATMDYDLQSRLTVINNIRTGTDNNDVFINEDGNTEPYFNPSIGLFNYKSILDSFYENSITVSAFRKFSREQAIYISWIKQNIDEGTPVIVHIKKTGDTSSEHAVVAYDYDDDGIYANFGWNAGSTHLPLLGGSAGYDQVVTAATLDYSTNKHVHSDNYIIAGEEHCGCNISDEVFISGGGNHRNVPPTYYWMKDSENEEESYILVIKSSSYQFISPINPYIAILTTSNSVTLSLLDWEAIYDFIGSSYYVILTRISDAVTYNPTNTYFSLKNTSATCYSITPDSYGYEQQYFFATKEQQIAQSNITFNTRRLRTGYIEQQYINLSANRKDAGIASIEYEFDQAIGRIDIDLCFWSALEGLNQSTGTAVLQYKDIDGNWITILDLLNDVTLATDRLNPTTYQIVFPEQTSTFRVYSTCFNPLTTSNKGRICIGDLLVYIA